MKMSINYGPDGPARRVICYEVGKIIHSGISAAFSSLGDIVKDIEVVLAVPPQSHAIGCDKNVVAELEVVIRDEALRDKNGRFSHCELRYTAEPVNEDQVKGVVIEMVKTLFQKKADRKREENQEVQYQLQSLSEIGCEVV